MDPNGSKDEDGATAVLSISGMTCGGCVSTVTRLLCRVPGVASAEVDLASGRAVVTGGARPEELIAAVQSAGYGAKPSQDITKFGEQNERGGSGC